MITTKLASFLLALFFSIALISCGEKTETSKTDEKSVTKTEANTNQQTNSKTTESKDTAMTKTETETKETETKEKDTKASDGDYVKMETNMGTIKIKLYTDKAPITTGNFKNLVNEGFYNGIIFHRVIDGFMIQGGDPTGTGTGGSKKTIQDEFGPGLKHSKAGILSMANRGPNTGTSQFFITLDATPWLDGKHAIFGEVVEGMDVVKKIGKLKTGQNDKPVEEVKMTKVTLTEK